jgi:hypothetical protein
LQLLPELHCRFFFGAFALLKINFEIAPIFKKDSLSNKKMTAFFAPKSYMLLSKLKSVKAM